MALFALGLNHHTAPLAVRERVVFHVERLREALSALRSDLAAEAAILSTCNRTELYLAAGEAPTAAAEWFARYDRLVRAELGRSHYPLPHEPAWRHGVRVPAGLDPMIGGEPQILGQMKD